MEIAVSRLVNNSSKFIRQGWNWLANLPARGETLRLKKSFLLPYVKAISQDSVLDVGCGDHEVTSSTPFKNYRRIDLLRPAIEIAHATRPDCRFDNIGIQEIGDDAYDYVICLDVLIHQSSIENFEEIVANLLRVARKGMIVSGYERANSNEGNAFAHLPLPEALRRHRKARELREVGSYRDVSLYLVLTDQGLPLTGADASLVDVAYGCQETADWRLLLELTRLSREKLGFFPKTITRTLEYPWFASQLRAGLRHRVLDIGAGVCVLPLWLAQQGIDVVTIDSSPQRDLDNKAGWNEWGYLDYSRLDARIVSHNLDAQLYEPERPFNAIYSVSVMEHMPRNVRRNVLNKLPSWLAPGGRVFLSLDLTSGTDDLWPLSEGQVVDREQHHGTLHDVAAEMKQAGLQVIKVAVRRRIAGSKTDVAFIEAEFVGSCG
jgi:2-polyprenyl-3-methyl-5-hydroxy-6-metoxy-1,4-benzoquinol methylase